MIEAGAFSRRRRRRSPFPAVRRLVVGGSCVALVGLGACGDFTPYNRLDKLRVLAVAGEPANPGPGETANLSALVYTPPGGIPVAYEWSWCPFPGLPNDGYPCLVTEEEVSALTGTPMTFDLGTAERAALPHTVPPDALRALCEGTPGVPRFRDCEGGFPIQIRLRVSSGVESVTAIHTVRLRFDPSTEINANPRVDGLIAVLPDGDRPITEDAALVTLPRNRETTLRALVPDGASEAFTTTDDMGRPTVTRERLFLTWFVESGTTDDTRTGFIEGSVPFEQALTNSWKPAKTEDYPAETARLIVVVRDSRGGSSWRSGIVTLEDSP